MDKLDIFQARYLKLDEFGWWDLEIIQTDSITQFTSKKFQKNLSVHGVHLTLVALYDQEINGQVEVAWRTLRNIAHSTMVHARVSNKYI